MNLSELILPIVWCKKSAPGIHTKNTEKTKSTKEERRNCWPKAMR